MLCAKVFFLFFLFFFCMGRVCEPCFFRAGTPAHALQMQSFSTLTEYIPSGFAWAVGVGPAV